LNEQERQLKAKRFAEEVGLLFDEYGLPRMAGRIFGWLLICDPPYQSIGEISDALAASKSSISTMTRLLMQLGAIERVGVPGARREYFRVRVGASNFARQMMAQVRTMRKLSECGLEVLAGSEAHLRERLQMMHDICTFFEEGLPALVQRWEMKNTAGRQGHSGAQG